VKFNIFNYCRFAHKDIKSLISFILRDTESVKRVNDTTPLHLLTVYLNTGTGKIKLLAIFI